MLVDMVQLLFARLPQFKEEIKFSAVKKVIYKNFERYDFLTLISFSFCLNQAYYER